MSVELQISRYLSDARQLRESMRTNGRDFEFAKAGGRIVYFVDANIASMFANPKGSTNQLRVFANWLDEKFLLSTATLAAEFIFSKKLPGQLDDEPVYMTPDHYDDLQSMANGIRKRGADLTQKVNQSELASMKDRGNEINNLIADYQNGSVNAVLLLNRLGQLLPLAIMEMLVGPIAEARQLRRLIEDSRLVRADGAQWFHRELLEPAPKLVADWVMKIQKEVNAGSYDRTEEKLFRDARSVLQLMSLSAEAPRDLKYIFVTTDSAIRIAYNKYSRNERAEGRSPLRINFRRPREFAPLLNLSSMSGHDEMYELFPLIERALDDLLVIKDVSGVMGDDRGELDPQQLIKNLQSWWSRAATTALTINSGYIAEREEANFRSIQQVLSEDDVVKAAISQLRETIDHVSSAHVRLALGGAVGQYLKTAHARLLQEPDFLARRAPLQFKSEPFRDFIGATPINDYLNNLYRGRARLPPLDALVANKNIGLSFLFATCVALTAEDWRSASSLAEHALSLMPELRNEETLDEARYCRAVSIRFAMKSKTDFEAAMKLLEQCIKYSEKTRSHFGRLRATAEVASLYCVFFFRAKIVKRCEPGNIGELWSRCSKFLHEASIIIDEISAPPQSREYKLYERAIIQVYAVKAALAIYEHWINPGEGRISEDDRRRHRKELTELERAIAEWNEHSDAADAPYTAQVFAGVLKFILADGDEERSEARSSAERLLQSLLNFEEQLLDLDQEEFRFFLKRMSTFAIE
jgi:hypothetical protein